MSSNSPSEYFIIEERTRSVPIKYTMKNLSFVEYASLLVDLHEGKPRSEEVFTKIGDDHFIRQEYFEGSFIQANKYIKADMVFEIKNGYAINEEPKYHGLEKFDTPDLEEKNKEPEQDEETKQQFAKLFISVLSKKDFKTADSLIKSGIDINLKLDGKPIFTHIAEQNNKEALIYLINNNVDVLAALEKPDEKPAYITHFENLEKLSKEFRDSFGTLKDSDNPAKQMEEALKIYNKANGVFKKVMDVVSIANPQKRIAFEAISAMATILKNVADKNKKDNRPK